MLQQIQMTKNDAIIQSLHSANCRSLNLCLNLNFESDCLNPNLNLHFNTCNIDSSKIARFRTRLDSTRLDCLFQLDDSYLLLFLTMSSSIKSGKSTIIKGANVATFMLK